MSDIVPVVELPADAFGEIVGKVSEGVDRFYRDHVKGKRMTPQLATHALRHIAFALRDLQAEGMPYHWTVRCVAVENRIEGSIQFQHERVLPDLLLDEAPPIEKLTWTWT